MSPPRPSPFTVALRLGRVSNLPTVWTNVLAGVALSGGRLEPRLVAPLVAAMSLTYVGGMYLNDGFDAGWDATHRSDRPIPAGLVSKRTVLLAGFGMLAAALAVLAVFTRPAAVLAGAALMALVVAYDMFHKGNPVAPVLMGLCRAGVYMTGAVAATGRPSQVALLAGAGLASYVIGLSFVARQELKPRLDRLWPLAFLLPPIVHAVLHGLHARGGYVAAGVFLGWTAAAVSYLRGLRAKPDVPRAVVSLIAGIALHDAVLLAAFSGAPAMVAALAAFALTVALQRVVPGT